MTAGFITVEHGISEHHSNLGAGNLGAWNHGPPNQKWERRTNVVDPSQAGSSLSLNEHAGFSIALRELRVGVNDEQSTILPLAQDCEASRKYQLGG